MLSTSLSLLPAGIINGFMFGAIYALVALGLTLIYGVLHIINFAHGAMLMLALYSAYFLFKILNIDPYVAILIVTPASFIFGYVIYRWGIGKLSGGKDQNILLITLGLSIILENAALFFFTGDQQTISLSYSYDSLDLGFLYLSYPKLISFIASLVICGLLWMLMTLTDLGKAIRAVAKQREGARLVGIDVEHVFAVTFGIGIACLGAAGCMLLPIFYVDPYTGNVFVIIAFTIVVLGGMGSIVGALLGHGDTCDREMRPVSGALGTLLADRLHHRLAQVCGAFGDDDAGGFHGFDLALSVALAARDDGAGMAHAPPRWCRAPGNEPGHRLLDLGLADELCRILFRRSADFAYHDDRLRLGVSEEHLQDINELRALHRITANTHRTCLAKPGDRCLINGLICQRP